MKTSESKHSSPQKSSKSDKKPFFSKEGQMGFYNNEKEDTFFTKEDSKNGISEKKEPTFFQRKLNSEQSNKKVENKASFNSGNPSFAKAKSTSGGIIQRKKKANEEVQLKEEMDKEMDRDVSFRSVFDSGGDPNEDSPLHSSSQSVKAGPFPRIQKKSNSEHGQAAESPHLLSHRFLNQPILNEVISNNRLLAYGSKNEGVRIVQQALVDIGYSLPGFGVDGLYYSETKKAVQAFQKDHFLNQDGIVGPHTLSILDLRFIAEPAGGDTPVQPSYIVPDVPEGERAFLESGQMYLSDFLVELERLTCERMNEALEGTGYSSKSCEVLLWFIEYLKSSSPGEVEELIRKFAPETGGQTNASAVIELVSSRAFDIGLHWANTGQLSGLPAELRSHIPDEVINNVKEQLGISFKASRGGARQTQTPFAVMRQLGKGKSMEGGNRRKMEHAFGSSFSDVQIHTDSQAAQLNREMNARAFSVGHHVAFGEGQYQPGSLMGDALMAHELAHVEQHRRVSRQQEKQGEDDEKLSTLRSDEEYESSREGGEQEGLKLRRCDTYSDLEPRQKQELRERILRETSVIFDPNPSNKPIYSGTSLSIRLDAPVTTFDGGREFPHIKSLKYVFPDGREVVRQVNAVSNQFATVGSGIHKIILELHHVPDMLPAKMIKTINVKTLRDLSDPVAQEDISSSKRGSTLFDELLTLDNASNELRKNALSVGLSPELLNSWFDANTKVIVAEGLLANNKQVEETALSEMKEKVGAFYQALRSAVSDRDVKTTKKFEIEGEEVEYEITNNPFMAPGVFNGRMFRLRDERVSVSHKIDDFLNTTKAFDKFIAELYRNRGDNKSADSLAPTTSTANSLRQIYREHGNMQSLKAVFYPLEQTQLDGGVEEGAEIPEDYRAKKYDLRFYVYKTVEDSEITWHLVDATNPEEVRETEEEGGTETNPPDELFTELDNASRFPKGVLYWQMPGQPLKSHDITHPITFTQFLTYLGIGLALIAITVATAGAGTTATVFFVASGIAGAAGAISDLREKSELGVLTAGDIGLNVLTIATSLLSAGTAAAGRVIATGAGATGKFARLAVGLDKIYKPLAGVTLAADAVSVAVFTTEFASQVNAVISNSQLTGDARKEAMTRLIFQGLLMGGLNVLAVKGSIADFNRGRSLYLDLNPTGPRARLLLPDDALLGSSLVGTRQTELSDLFNQLNTPETQRQLYQLRAELSGALESGHLKKADIEKFIDDLKATNGDAVKIGSLIDEFRARNLELAVADYKKFKVKATGKGLTESQAAISYDVAQSVPNIALSQSIDKTKSFDEQLDELYAQATVADVELKSLVRGIADDTGGTAGFRPSNTNGGLKGRDRAIEKIQDDYKGDVSQLVDVAGAKITFDRVDDLYEALRIISLRGNVVRFKDKIVDFYDSGYGDIKLNLEMSNGHIIELKLLPKTIDAISEVEHGLYEKIRRGESLTPQEQEQMDGFKRQYESAWGELFDANS